MFLLITVRLCYPGDRNAVYHSDHETRRQSSSVSPTHGEPAHPRTSPHLAVVPTDGLERSDVLRSGPLSGGRLLTRPGWARRSHAPLAPSPGVLPVARRDHGTANCHPLSELGAELPPQAACSAGRLRWPSRNPRLGWEAGGPRPPLPPLLLFFKGESLKSTLP